MRVSSALALFFLAPAIGELSMPPWRPARLALLGFVTALALFLVFGAGPHLIDAPAVLMLLGAALVFTVFRLLARFEWTDRRRYHKFAVTAGALGFFIALTPLQELDQSRLNNPRGMLIVGIVAAAMLLLLRDKLKKVGLSAT